MIVRDEDQNELEQSQQNQGAGFQGGESFSGSGGGGGGPTVTGNAGVGSPSASANEASGGFVNLEDYLRANSGSLGQYGKMAEQDVGELKSQNKGVFDSLSGNSPSNRKSVSDVNWTAYNDKLTDDEKYFEGWNKLDPVGMKPGYWEGSIYRSGGRADPSMSDWNKNRFISQHGHTWDFKKDKNGNPAQLRTSAEEADWLNKDTQELKRYLSEKRNKSLRGGYDDALKKAQSLNYDESLINDANLADPESTKRAISKIQADANKMQDEDYWTGRLGFDKERGVGNPLDAFLAYQGGGKAAAEQAKGFSGLEEQLRNRLGLRDKELANKSVVESAQADLDARAANAAKDMSIDEILAEQGAGGEQWWKLQDNIAKKNRDARKKTKEDVWKMLM
jgi:hypothetical protein